MLENGTLRAVDARNRTCWKLSYRSAFVDEGREFRPNSVVFSGDRKLIAVRGEETAQIRESATGKLRFKCVLYNRSIADVPRGFQLANFQLATLPGAGDYVTGMAFSPDGRHFALAGWRNIELNDGVDGFPGTIIPSGRVRVFRVSSGRIARTFDVQKAHVEGARWTSNARLSAKCGDGRTRAFGL